MKRNPVIGFIGSGNAAWCLSHAFKNAGIQIAGIASRNKKSGQKLAKEIRTVFTDIQTLVDSVDVCFICVQDRFIKEVVSGIEAEDCLIVHCSGSVSIDELSSVKHNGVFWPVISMRINGITDFTDIPVCIETSTTADSRILNQLTESIRAKPVKINSARRRQLHLAAVFANNFSNACYIASEKISKKAGKDFKLLLPLILQGNDMLQHFSPKENQTGPARRKDLKVMKQHLEMLKEMPEERKVYKAVSDYIGRVTSDQGQRDTGTQGHRDTGTQRNSD